VKYIDRFFFGYLFLAMLIVFVSFIAAAITFIVAHKIPCIIIGLGAPAIYFLGWALQCLVGEK
jgi:hypothetical protein